MHVADGPADDAAHILIAFDPAHVHAVGDTAVPASLEAGNAADTHAVIIIRPHFFRLAFHDALVPAADDRAGGRARYAAALKHCGSHFASESAVFDPSQVVAHNAAGAYAGLDLALDGQVFHSAGVAAEQSHIVPQDFIGEQPGDRMAASVEGTGEGIGRRANGKPASDVLAADVGQVDIGMQFNKAVLVGVATPDHVSEIEKISDTIDDIGILLRTVRYVCFDADNDDGLWDVGGDLDGPGLRHRHQPQHHT